MSQANQVAQTARRLVLGIDPGLTGAFALLDPALRDLRGIYDMPKKALNGSARRRQICARSISNWIRIWEPSIEATVIEGVHSMPRDGHVGAFSFGKGFGLVLGALAAEGIEPVSLDPAAWKSAMGLGRDKNESRHLAAQTFPRWAGHFSKKKDDGRAEAALMALFAARTLGRLR